MSEYTYTKKRLRREAITKLLTAEDGRIPILSHMAAVLMWLVCAVGTRYVLDSLPLEIPMLVGDILQLGITLPLGVGAAGYITGKGGMFGAFDSVTAYTDAWKTALLFPFRVFGKPVLMRLNLALTWHLIPVILTSGLWLFVFIPYCVTVNSLYLSDINHQQNCVKNFNNINTTGGNNLNGS